MEKLNDLGYVPRNGREFRLQFRQPRDISHPDLSSASVQLARGDRYLFTEAKKFESDQRRIWFFLTFPCSGTVSKDEKQVVKIDLLIATPAGAMIIKVLDWSGPCTTTPGSKWIERKSDGTKVEYPNQLAELDSASQWVRLFLEKNDACPASLTSYILLPSPHVKPDFTSDPRIIVGPAACKALVLGNGPQNELTLTKNYLEWGQTALKSAMSYIKRSPQNESNNNSASPIDNSVQTEWRRFQQCLDATPQFDLLLLRKNACLIFGNFIRIETSNNDRDAKPLERFFSRTTTRTFRFEHSTNGLLGAPLALVSGGLGLEPTCRIRHASFSGESVGHIDVSPDTRLIFRAYGCEGLVSAEVNDVEYFELARIPRSLDVAEDGTEVSVVNQLGNMIGGMVKSSIQAGVKNVLPFPFNTIVNQF